MKAQEKDPKMDEVKVSSFEFEPETTFKFSKNLAFNNVSDSDYYYSVENKIEGESSFDFEPKTTFEF